MYPVVYLLAPLLVAISAPDGVGPVREPDFGTFPVKPKNANQVSIMQSVTVRIGPRPAPIPKPALMLADSADGDAPQFQERRIGKCLNVNWIEGVQPVSRNKLLLIMRDSRMITAELGKGCESRQFYSGFIIKRSGDGQICTTRDPLLSRSGGSCQVIGFRQLVPVGGF